MPAVAAPAPDSSAVSALRARRRPRSEQVLGLLGERDRAVEARVAGDRLAQDGADVVVGERLEREHEAAAHSRLTTEKNGFSVVAAIRLTIRSSTALSSESCWVLENRWTSSMNSTVRRPA